MAVRQVEKNRLIQLTVGILAEWESDSEVFLGSIVIALFVVGNTDLIEDLRVSLTYLFRLIKLQKSGWDVVHS